MSGDSQAITRTVKGLYSQYNRLEAPKGALLLADNCVIDRPGVLEKRRGFNRYGQALGAAGATSMKYLRRLVLLDGTTLKYDSDGAGTWTAYSGTYSAPTGARMQGVEAQGSFHFTSSAGLYKLDSLTGTPKSAGLPPGLDVQLASSGGSGFVPTDSQIGYEVLWGRTDANAKEAVGAPSGQTYYTNVAGGASCNIALTTTIPAEMASGDWLEIYRTVATGSDDTVPDDRYRFVRRITLTSTDITNGYVTYTDTGTDLGDDLYTNPLKETGGKSNDQPPFAKFIALWKGHLWLANTRERHRKQVRFLDVAGITDDTDTVTFTTGGVSLTYTFSTAENIAQHKFQRFTGGVLSVNLRNTMQSLCKVVNRDTGNSLIYARYTSGAGGQPGIIEITRRNLTDSAITFTATAGCGGKFEPSLPTAGTTVASSCDEKKNGVYRSKFEKFEAVPISNYDPVGSSNDEVLGITAQKDALIVETQGGYHMISGESDGLSGMNFTVTPLDPTLNVVAPGSITSLDNSVYAFTSQGVVRTTEAGSKIMSWPIENDLAKIAQLSNFSTVAFAIPYESDRSYLLGTQERSGDTKAQVLWRYNYVTEAWSRWKFQSGAIAGGVVIDTATGGDTLYLTHADDAYVLKERKSRSDSDEDFTDEAIPFTVTSSGTTTNEDGDTVTTVTGTYTYDVVIRDGWLFEQGTVEGIVDSATHTGTTYTLTLDRQITVSAGAATVGVPIVMDVQWMPEAVGNAASMKQFAEGQLYFEKDGGTHVMGFCSDLHNTPEYTRDIEIAKTHGWGTSAWGTTPWGDALPAPSSPIRAMVPRNHQRCRAMRVHYENHQAKEGVHILQMTLSVRPYGERTMRNPR